MERYLEIGMNCFSYVMNILSYSMDLFLFFIIFSVVYMIIKDKTQTKHTLRRNYPLFGRGRWIMEYLGHFVRAYFITDDRSEKPYSRNDRSYAYQAAKDEQRTKAFGSTLDPEKSIYSFIHSQFPYKSDDSKTLDYITPITYGSHLANPCTSSSRINISAMSYGSLSDVAVLSLSKGANKGNFLMNCGEGGLSKFHEKGGADIIFQIGTAKYGCSNPDLSLNVGKITKLSEKDSIKMFEIKLSQGAKPGKGGILPANKVTKEIAEARNIEVGVSSISPSTHTEVFDNKSLLDLIYKIKKATEKPTGIKLCLGEPEQLDDLFLMIRNLLDNPVEGIDSQYYVPDFITIDSSYGGTGAAPMAHMDAIGMDLAESLPSIVKSLRNFNLKEKIKVIASGKLLTPVQAAWAFCEGADSINIGRGFLFSLGCIQALECNKNKCPTGITTHNKKYTKGLVPEDKYKRVYKYHYNLSKDLVDLAHSCGVQSFEFLGKKHIRYNKFIPIKNN